MATAKEQARLARQRRKEAKQAARQAKKQARLAKAQVAEAKLALTELKTRLARPIKPTPVRRKPRSLAVKKVAVAPRQKSPVADVAAPPRKTLKVSQPVARRTTAKRKVVPTSKAVKRSLAVPHELETPVAIISPADSKATAQIVKGVEEIFTGFTGEIPADAPVETDVPAGIAPPDQSLNHADIKPQETL